MKAWENKTTLEILNDIQDIPNPLPSEYSAEEWELTDVTEAEITAFAKIKAYVHTARGLAGLFTEPFTLFTHHMEEFV